MEKICQLKQKNSTLLEWDDATGCHSSLVVQYLQQYPLLNVYITMENHLFFMGKLTISMAIFNSYVKLPEGNDQYSLVN